MRAPLALFFTAIFALVNFGFAQEPFDQEFEPDTLAPVKFRVNRTSYSAIMDVLEPSRSEVTDEQLEALKHVPLGVIFSALGDYRLNYVTGFENTQPGARLVGRALTMRFLPARPDLTEAALALADEGNWDRRYYARAAEEARAGDVVVAEAVVDRVLGEPGRVAAAGVVERVRRHAARRAGLREEVVRRARGRHGGVELVEDAELRGDRALHGDLLRREQRRRDAARRRAVQARVGVALGTVGVRVRVAAGAELAVERRVARRPRADVGRRAAGHVDRALGRVRRVQRERVAPVDAVEALEPHATKVVVRRVVLHVEHDEVVDLVLARRRREARLALAELAPDLFHGHVHELPELLVALRLRRLVVVVVVAGVGAAEAESRAEQRAGPHSVWLGRIATKLHGELHHYFNVETKRRKMTSAPGPAP